MTFIRIFLQGYIGNCNLSFPPPHITTNLNFLPSYTMTKIKWCTSCGPGWSRSTTCSSHVTHMLPAPKPAEAARPRRPAGHISILGRKNGARPALLEQQNCET